ncbi:TetR/AcrR family transcriptional regulator [Microbacterium sp.]|jgi:AcrR family transcriptional regulator|uniref:TetR/AcrR family transcriptional regulator n=1 Tax=Microbacterium sp. TaxID=51671 RepID=UPI0037C8A4D2
MPETTPRRRGEYSKSAQRREDILDAAAAVFSRAGFGAASLAEIAERAGISVAGLNHHFATKTQLLEAVFDRTQRQAETFFQSSDPIELLRSAVSLAAQNASDPLATRFFAVMSAEATSPDHPAHDYFQRRYAETVEQVLASFATLRDQGRLRAEVTPEEAARAYMALSDGLQIQALYDPEAFSQPAMLRRLLSSFLTEPL